MVARWKLYALAALAFVAGLLGWRKIGIDAALAAEKAKANAERLTTIRKVREYERDAETQDDPELVRRLTRRD